MNKADVQAFRHRWRLTQKELAEYLTISPGEGTVSHQMVSQMERGDRPIPTRPRWMADMKEPSILEMLEELLAASDEEVRELLAPVPRAPRGPYS